MTPYEQGYAARMSYKLGSKRYQIAMLKACIRWELWHEVEEFAQWLNGWKTAHYDLAAEMS